MTSFYVSSFHNAVHKILTHKMKREREKVDQVTNDQ